MALGIKTRSIYEEDFEQPFLEVSGEFFKVNHILVALILCTLYSKGYGCECQNVYI